MSFEDPSNPRLSVILWFCRLGSQSCFSLSYAGITKKRILLTVCLAYIKISYFSLFISHRNKCSDLRNLNHYLNHQTAFFFSGCMCTFGLQCFSLSLFLNQNWNHDLKKLYLDIGLKSWFSEERCDMTGKFASSLPFALPLCSQPQVNSTHWGVLICWLNHYMPMSKHHQSQLKLDQKQTGKYKGAYLNFAGCYGNIFSSAWQT